MMPRVTRRRAAGRWRAVLPAPTRHSGAGHHRSARPLRISRAAATRPVPRTWWRRLTDDREFVGAKVLVLAALLALTAVLECAV